MRTLFAARQRRNQGTFPQYPRIFRFLRVSVPFWSRLADRPRGCQILAGYCGPHCKDDCLRAVTEPFSTCVTHSECNSQSFLRVSEPIASGTAPGSLEQSLCKFQPELRKTCEICFTQRWQSLVNSILRQEDPRP